MSKLDPRPEPVQATNTWDDLNRMLQNRFSGKSTNPAVMIDVRDYLMSKDEIISEAEKQGYKVTEQNEHVLLFE